MKIFKKVCCLAFVLINYLSDGNGSIISSGDSIVQISNGTIRGISAVSRSGNQYHQFLGIPYAKPPVGDLRFEPPQRPNNWTIVKDTTHLKQPCLQYEIMFLKRIKGIEDCLYLNVFTPNMPGSSSTASIEGQQIPVMVFLHGGGFMSGNPREYGGKYFMDENVILVTIAYRLGALGFLSTGDTLIRGNMGLKDQRMGLQWVQENIKHFGGDNNRITLFGESSGASATHWHVLSPKSKGLFQKAISETGSALRRYPNTNDYAGQARNLASKVGCPVNSTKEMVSCLKTVNAMRIVETHTEATETLRSDYSIYGPIVETVKDDEAFFTEEPETLLETGNYAKVPWITGINSADGILFASEYVKDRTTAKQLESLESWRKHLPRLLRFDDDDLIKASKAADKIREFYFGNGSPSDVMSFQNLTNMFSDRMYFLPNFNAVRLQSPSSPVYLYYFDYKTMGSIHKLVEGVRRDRRILPPELQIATHFVRSWFDENILGIERPFYGAAHADELFLLFNLNPLFEASPGTSDYQASLAMVRTWANFARDNSTDQVTYNGIPWPKVTDQEKLNYLRIGRKVNVINDPIENRMKFWKSLSLTFLGRLL